jgi:hypothetical protein
MPCPFLPSRHTPIRPGRGITQELGGLTGIFQAAMVGLGELPKSRTDPFSILKFSASGDLRQDVVGEKIKIGFLNSRSGRVTPHGKAAAHRIA